MYLDSFFISNNSSCLHDYYVSSKNLIHFQDSCKSTNTSKKQNQSKKEIINIISNEDNQSSDEEESLLSDGSDISNNLIFESLNDKYKEILNKKKILKNLSSNMLLSNFKKPQEKLSIENIQSNKKINIDTYRYKKKI